MRPRLEKRLDELKAEFESGQKMLAELLDKENRPTGKEEEQLNEQDERVIQQHEPLSGKA
jgi:hypothetical protein